MPHVIIIAGPNGAGKSTIAPYLLRDKLGVSEFVNADTIAQGLSAYSPEKAAIPAGRVMLDRINELAKNGENFAFETTLAAKSFVPKLEQFKNNGYEITLIFLWLANVQIAVERVAERVRQGGHNIPKATIERRYKRGLINFFSRYKNLADNWYFYDNSKTGDFRLIAKGKHSKPTEISDAQLWDELRKENEKQ